MVSLGGLVGGIGGVKSVRITWCGREWFRWLIGCGVVGFWN